MNQLPKTLVDAAKNQTLVVFVGSGCSLSAGVPGWPSLLKQTAARFDEDQLLDSRDKGQLKQYMDKGGLDSYQRYAELLQRKNEYLLRSTVADLIDPPEGGDLYPPEYLKLLRDMDIRQIVTTNYDKVLEAALGPRWNPITWQDFDELVFYRRKGRPFIYHIHGAISHAKSLILSHSQYQKLGEERHQAARKFFVNFCREKVVLFVGYGMGDPIIDEAFETVTSEDELPIWFKLQASVSDTDREEAEAKWRGGLRLLSYDPEEDDHDTPLYQFFYNLASEAGTDMSKIPAIMPKRSDDSKLGPWLEVDDALLAGSVGKKDCHAYYKGRSASWAMVAQGFSVEREQLAELLASHGKGTLEHLLLITGEGGEGKSTLARQFALKLRDLGYRVFEAQTKAADPFRCINEQRGKLCLLIDRDIKLESSELKRLANFVANRSVQIIMTARPHEWRHRFGMGRFDKLRQVSIRRIKRSEALAIADKLLESHLVTGDRDTLGHSLERNQYLLAGMLEATHGKGLHAILRDVVAKVAEWREGERYLLALALVSYFDRFDLENRYCSVDLFGEVLAVKGRVERFCEALVGELHLAISGYRIKSRHPLIAKHLYKILCMETDLVSELELEIKMIEAVGRILSIDPKSVLRNMLTVIPRERQKDDPHGAIKVYEVASKVESENPLIWQNWALLKKEQDGLGDIDEPSSARWLFKRGTDADGKHVQSWQAWAVAEVDAGNLGSLAEEYSGRWLFKRGTDADRKHAPLWQAWARAEVGAGKLGSLAEEYSGRWLFKRGTDADGKHAPLWQAWAVAEVDAGNLGSLDEEYSGRWLFKRGTDVDRKDAHLWQAWAAAERDYGDHTRARELVDQGLWHCPNHSRLKTLRFNLDRGQHSDAPRCHELLAEGSFAEARRLAEAALVENPTDPELKSIIYRAEREIRCR